MWIEKSHYNSRVSLHEAATKNYLYSGIFAGGQTVHPGIVNYSQTRMKETQWAVRKGFLLSIVFISCPINVESLTCIKSEE